MRYKDGDYSYSYIDKFWVEKILGKKRMEWVEEMDVYESCDGGYCIDIMLYEDYESDDGRTMLLISTDEMTKAEIKDDLLHEFSLFQPKEFWTQ